MLKVRCFYNEPKGMSWKHFQEMLPRLGQKYDLKIEVTSKSREEYHSNEYSRLNLPVAPTIMVEDEIVVEGADISEEKLENAIRTKLGLGSVVA